MTFELDIILAAHGAGDHSLANARVRQWARELETSHAGARVVAAFHLGTPSYDEALSGADRVNRIVIPCLTSDGFHAERLRDAVGRAEQRSGRAIHTVPPIGAGGRDAFGIGARVEQALRTNCIDTASALVVVVGHGTTRHTQSAQTARNLSDAIRRLTGACSTVAFLDENPLVEDVIAKVGDWQNIVVVPFLLGGGHHVAHDLPERVRAGRAAHAGNSTWNIIELDAPSDVEVFQELARRIETYRSERTIVRAAARASALSRAQVEIFARHVDAIGMDVRLHTMSTAGDSDRETPLSALNMDDAFTGTIDAALLEGSVDVAIHSLKDLPLDQPAAVQDIYLARGPVYDVLVSRDHVAVKDLPLHARVGVSCDRRARQLRLNRPDLEPVAIRGAVPDRLAALDRGDYDALVLAEAGLERLGLAHRITQRFGFRTMAPAAGQGAIVVRCRTDSPLLPQLRQLDDSHTRLAVETELAFARLVKQYDGGVAAAQAMVSHGVIHLRARRLHARLPDFVDAESSGIDPESVALAAACATGIPAKAPQQDNP